MSEPPQAPVATAERRPPRGRRIAWTISLAILAATVALTVRAGEPARFARLLERAQPAWLLVGALLQLGTYLAAGAVLRRGLGRAGAGWSPLSLAPLGLMKLFVDQAVPMAGIGGTLLVVRALQRRGVEEAAASRAVVAGLFGFFAAYAIAIAVSVAWLWLRGDLRPDVLALTTLGGLVLVALPAGFLFLGRRGQHVPAWTRRIPALAAVLRTAGVAAAEAVRDPALIATVIGLQLAIFALDAATFWSMLRAVGENAPPMVAFTVFVMASVAATVSVLPGGVGAFEVGSVVLLRVLAVPLEAALAATLLLRGMTLWLPMLPGMWLARREVAGA
jgi:glycosyltransferase 2 family protein